MLNPIQNANEVLCREVPVRCPLGLHARPAAALSREAQQFSSSILLQTDTAKADAKSMLDILALAATQGTTITVTAHGADAREALDKLGNMIAGIEA